VRGIEKFVSLRFGLTIVFIVLGASLHSAGKVGFWGMFAVMMLPNIAFALLRFRKSPASTSRDLQE
jgi:lipopolysaccharide export LptBFGC system permease protein LptF